MFEAYMESLMKNELFQGMIPGEVEGMLECLKPSMKRVRRNEYIALAGEGFTGLGIMLSGEAVVSRENASGSRVVMTHLEPGDMFGEMFAFSSQAKWPVNVQALTDSDAMFLSRDKIVGTCGKACEWHQGLILNLMSIISEKALMLNKKLEYVSIRSMRGKLSTYLVEQHKRSGGNSFMLPMKRDELADFLNVSRPSMSRELGRMKDEGVIDFHRSAVRITDLDELKRMADS
ncbi:MAG: Crp/Fnr family transcriptional regulator [Clostridiales bacterium]|nr:Crp/Fnr family transcriptional regulator [Clostridiales bacterium]